MLDELALTFLGEQLHHDKHVFCTRRQIHRATNCGNRIGLASGPVGEITVHSNLECAEHTNIQVSATHHGERIGMMEIATTRQQGDRLLARIDQIPIFLSRCGRRPHAQYAVFTLQKNVFVLG